MKINLYIGAHKTATTHIQKILYLNKTVLNKKNIKVSLPSDLRKEWLPNFLKYTRGDNAELKRKILNEAPESGLWIIAEENFSGISKEHITSTEIYPNLNKRLEIFKRLFQENEIEVFFSIRSFESYFRSSYLEVVRNNGFFLFSKFYDENRFNDFSWLSVINSICEFIPEKNINIWCYENIEKVLPLVLSKLTTEEIRFQYPNGVTRTSLSERALKDLENISFRDRDDLKSYIESLDKKYPSSKDYPVFEPFNELQTSYYKKKYLREVKLLKEKYPSINILDKGYYDEDS